MMPLLSPAHLLAVDACPKCHHSILEDHGVNASADRDLYEERLCQACHKVCRWPNVRVRP